MKGHGCYLANGAWLEGRDNQDNLATWHEMFLEKSILGVNFATNQVSMIELSFVNVIQCCMMIGWTYLAHHPSFFFASNLEWLVTKIPEGVFSQLYSYAHFTRAL
jgi:hypothetical protein